MINYAVIGCGIIGAVHCAAIRAEGQSRLKAVCDIDKVKAEKYAQEYQCDHTTDFKNILNDPEIQAVTICLPHHEHLRFFEEALRCGKHVVCEKPLAIKPEDISRMVSLSENVSNLTTIAFQHRHSPLVQELKKSLVQEDFGKLVKGKISFKCERTMEYYNSGTWRGKWETEGGGTLINQAIHTLDLACLFMGSPKGVYGMVKNTGLPLIEVENFAQGKILLDNGLEIELEAENSADFPWEPLISVEGTKGSFILEGSDVLKDIRLESSEVRDRLREKERMMKGDHSQPGKEEYGNLHNFVFSDFTSALISGGKPLLSVREAAVANEVVLAFYQSIVNKKIVKFPIRDYTYPCLTKIK